MRHNWFVALLLVPALTLADTFDDQLERASTAWADGDTAGAVKAVGAALRLARERQAEQLGVFFPVPADGWTAEPPQREGAVLGDSLVLVQPHRAGEGGAVVEVSLIADSPLIAATTMLFDFPDMGAPEAVVETIDGREVLIDSAMQSVQVLIGRRAVLTATQVEGEFDPEQLTAILLAADLAGMEGALGR